MSSSDEPRLEPLPGEELVAYLDGELPPDESRRIEERLTADAEYRRQLRDLDQAWEALDVLPQTAADDNFARTTIEMVSLAAARELSENSAKTAAARRKRLLLWSAAGLAAAFAGFAAAGMLLPNPNDDLLADLPVIQQLDVLSQIEEVDFLRRLPEAVPIEQLAQDDAAVEQDLAELQAAAAPSREARQRWVNSLPPEQKAILASQLKRFKDLREKPGQQQRLRELERGIRQADDADKLQTTLLAYSRWLAQRLPVDREDLRTLPTDERLDLIRQIVREDEERALRHLSAKDSAALRQEIMEIYKERESAFRKDLRRRDHDNRPPFDGPEARKALIVLNWELRNDHRDDRTRDRLIKQLSPEAQAHWDKISRRGRLRRQLQLWRWISESMQPKWGPDELERFFANDLDNRQRERLLNLPPEEMRSQLERLYLADQYGLHDPTAWLGELGEGSSFPRTPRPDESR